MTNPKTHKRLGHALIRYRGKDAAHNGWIVEGELGDKLIGVELVGFERTYRLGVEEQKHIVLLSRAD